MNTSHFKNSYLFLSYILSSTDHTLQSLAEILDIPKKRFYGINKFTKEDHQKIHELKKMMKFA